MVGSAGIVGYRVEAIDSRGITQHQQDFMIWDLPNAEAIASIHWESISRLYSECDVIIIDLHDEDIIKE